MQVTITARRTTTYATIVEMNVEDFLRYQCALEDGTRDEEKNASRNLNQMIDINDWQDDDLIDVEIEEFKP